ncbi:MAG: hypothetical protein RIH33_00115, partial [Marinoscillum sp.]|uniref:hypothetical protein n=1 Tax=Marinoscillum sp. TaxID=2024838 RepID=UPI0033024CA1
ESGRTDQVQVSVADQDEFPDYIGFKTPTGTIPSQTGKDKHTRELTLSGLMAGNPTTLTAFATQGSTDNLMDYLSAGATHLYKHQWDNVHNPEGVTSWLQDDEEGAMEAVFPSLYANASEVIYQLANPNCLYMVDPNGILFGVPKSKGDKVTLYISPDVPAGTIAQFRINETVYKFFESGYYYDLGDGYKSATFSGCETDQEQVENVYSVFEDKNCGQQKIVKGRFNVGSDVSGGLDLEFAEVVYQEGSPDDLPEVGETDLLKSGYLVGDFGGNGVMFSIKINKEDRYFFRRFTQSDFTEEFYLWEEGCGWITTNLVSAEVLEEYPDILTLMDIWTAIKNDPVHSGLGALGFIPVVGVVFDGADAFVYLIEGDVLGASFASAAIISSGVAYGVKTAVKIARSTKTVKTAIKLTDEYAEGMENLLKAAEASATSNLGVERLMTLQRSVMDLATKYGEDGMQKLLNLSNHMDEVEFLLVAEKLNDLDNGADLITDISNVGFADFIIANGGEGLDSWVKLSGFSPSIRTNVSNLTQRKLLDEYAGGIANATNARKGNFGEIGVDLDLNTKGYESLQPRIADINAPGHNGIDGVYRAPDGSYVIVEGKYTGSATLNPADPSTGLPRQMSDDWIQQNNGQRLLEAFGGDQGLVDDILDSGYSRVLAKVSPDGSVSYKYVSETGYLNQGGGPLGDWTP